MIIPAEQGEINLLTHFLLLNLNNVGFQKIHVPTPIGEVSLYSQEL